MARANRVDFKGPFFERDPSKTLKGNIDKLMDALAVEGERDVQVQIAAKAPAMRRYTGHTVAHVRGRAVSLVGKNWRTTAVVSMDTRGMSRKQAIRTQAAASSIEGRFHPFRRTKSAIRRARAIRMADLTKGIE